MPADCAQGICLPLFDPADIEALDWIAKAYSSLPPDLRQAEREIRGEIALRDVTVIQQGARLQQLWNCEGNGCQAPLQTAAESFRKMVAQR